MATDTDKLTTVNTTTTASPSSVEENPKNTVDTTDLVQNPTAAPSSTATTVGLKKDGEDSKTTAVAAVSPVSGDVAPGTDTLKKIRRAERFGMPVQLSEQEKRNSRAERFGTATKTSAPEVSKTSEELKRKARAERFGLPVPTSAGDQEEKKKARLARFAPYSKPDSLEEEKRKARALRFSGTPSSSLSQVNGQGNIEPKAAIAGNAGGGT
ncbi:hypothetical protein Pint_35533 [Pistacia integerrima]|uniref:Uncharacterized protein n=1 Tax=Pistacia integerrima TaxID=434235 RepID=A0ACC0Y232_9ROSI|nr:hypothetical protein Pint_35533 [Pistacia integerrima]